MRMKRAVTFGELLLSLCTRDHQRFAQADEFVARYTGAEANVAVSLARFGFEAFVVSRVPEHEIGQACIDYLRRFGVRTEYIVRGGDRLGILFMETGAAQRPSKVIYDRLHSSIRGARREEFEWERILEGKDWLHFSGTAPALGENVRAVLSDALTVAKRLGVAVSCDCNYRSKLWSMDEAGRMLRELMDRVDVVICGKDDPVRLFGLQVESKGREESARALREHFSLRCVAMTLREEVSASVNRLSALLCDATGCYASREYTMQIVDRVGGGDAFCGGLIYSLLCGYAGQQAIDFSVAASCLKHSIPGDFNLVSVQEVEALLADRASGRVQR